MCACAPLYLMCILLPWERWQWFVIHLYSYHIGHGGLIGHCESNEKLRDNLQTAICRSLKTGISTKNSCVMVIAAGPNLNPPLASGESM